MGSTIIRQREEKRYLYYVYYTSGERKEIYCGIDKTEGSKKKLSKAKILELKNKRTRIDNELSKLGGRK